MRNLSKKNTTALNISIILGLLIVLVVLACESRDNQTSENKKKDNNYTDSLVIELTGITGKTVFEITRKRYNVDFVESSMGIFVKAIDSIPATGNFVWIFSVNDSFVPIGSNDYITNDTDIIKWHYRKF